MKFLFNTAMFIICLAVICSCKCESDNDEAKQIEQSFSQQQNIDQELSKTELGKTYIELKKVDDELLDQNIELSDDKKQELQDRLNEIDDNLAPVEDKIEQSAGKNKNDFSQAAALFLEKAGVAESYGYKTAKMKDLATKLKQKSQ